MEFLKFLARATPAVFKRRRQPPAPTRRGGHYAWCNGRGCDLCVDMGLAVAISKCLHDVAQRAGPPAALEWHQARGIALRIAHAVQQHQLRESNR